MKKQRAVFGQVHNEPDFFPIWLRYYSKFYDPSDIYVLHLLKPKRVEFDSWLADQSGFVRVPVEDVQRCDFSEVVRRAEKLQRALLGQYECVLFAEVDEFVAHESGLDRYIDEWLKLGRQTEVVNGYEIVHRFWDDGVNPVESPIDLSRPLLPQRNWWYHAHLYDKPLLSRMPLDWAWGFHYCKQIPWQTTDPNLLLLHGYKIDYDLCVRRKLERLKNEEDSQLVKEHMPGSPGWQYYLENYEMMNWFKLSVDDGSYATHTEIPEHVRRLPL